VKLQNDFLSPQLVKKLHGQKSFWREENIIFVSHQPKWMAENKVLWKIKIIIHVEKLLNVSCLVGRLSSLCFQGKIWWEYHKENMLIF
jgi:hypothetical protein